MSENENPNTPASEPLSDSVSGHTDVFKHRGVQAITGSAVVDSVADEFEECADDEELLVFQRNGDFDARRSDATGLSDMSISVASGDADSGSDTAEDGETLSGTHSHEESNVSEGSGGSDDVSAGARNEDMELPDWLKDTKKEPEPAHGLPMNVSQWSLGLGTREVIFYGISAGELSRCCYVDKANVKIVASGRLSGGARTRVSRVLEIERFRFLNTDSSDDNSRVASISDPTIDHLLTHDWFQKEG
ncbi:hypothetical protein CYMTET_5890 [Cymbomonas tetramitiformis]|uniref:Uncharacterized protein n=1 Tax=Cymbomonas tetramitiformis TaxID=36881 RepID=A0AAE0LIM2_9CHLO|nr:hypothetical protein CYMTET_5890 [Cymbomonas tetramitiformis]